MILLIIITYEILWLAGKNFCFASTNSSSQNGVGGFSNDISNKGHKAHLWIDLQTNLRTLSKKLIVKNLELEKITHC